MWDVGYDLTRLNPRFKMVLRFSLQTLGRSLRHGCLQAWTYPSSGNGQTFVQKSMSRRPTLKNSLEGEALSTILAEVAGVWVTKRLDEFPLSEPSVEKTSIT